MSNLVVVKASTQFLFALAAFHDINLTSMLQPLLKDLGQVKPISTWLFLLLFIKYNDDRQVEIFQMTKSILFHIIDRLQMMLVKQDTRYQESIPVEIRCLVLSICLHIMSTSLFGSSFSQQENLLFLWYFMNLLLQLMLLSRNWFLGQ